MEYNVVAAIGAGLAGAVVMAVLLYMGIGMMPRQMQMNLFLLLGTMMVAAPGGTAYVMGGMMHLAMGAVFAIIHTALYQAFGLTSNLVAWGLLFGTVHGLIVGGGMGMMGAIHPRLRTGEMRAPGFMLLNYHRMTLGGFFMLHMLFGVVVGLIYGATA